MIISVIKIYSFIHEFLHQYLGINIRGLGFLYRLIKKDYILNVNEKKLFLNSKISDNYGRLINGRFNEPETHIFLDNILDHIGTHKSIHFVDIGANVGEFILDYYDRPYINTITAFEPQTEQIKSLKSTIEYNSISNVLLIEKCVSSTRDPIFFKMNDSNTTGSGITKSIDNSITLYPTTIDDEFKIEDKSTFIFLIDTEGAELDILKGGINFIKNKTPLIIFEYNHVTKNYFEISDVSNFLGPNYEIFRLRNDGKLDKNFRKTWNLVAVPKCFNSILHSKKFIVE